MRRLVLAATVLVSVVVAAVLALTVTGRDQVPHPGSADRTPAGAEARAQDVQGAARAFLDTYVDDDGRVVRTDQGGDTVSEGQAYGLLLAVGVGDEQTFERIWSWTHQNLLRPDGLLSWRYADGAIADPSSAADADLDAARALVLAGQRFDEASLSEAGVTLGTAMLDHETVATDAGLVLTAGSWAETAPYAFNPSYVSPVATTLLAEASGDERFTDLEAGSRAAVEALTAGGDLAPDWAELGEDGSVRPVPGPGGRPVQFGYDAARTLLRAAESCDTVDHAVATDGATRLGEHPAVASYDLAGSPQTDTSSPLTLMAQAAGRATGGDTTGARASLGAALAARDEAPTYYGDAWAALGQMMLTGDELGGCPPLAAAS